MAKTPEGNIKRKINLLLDSYGNHVYTFMPVPSGYGVATIDYFVCMDGIFVGIEAKAPGKRPTARQESTLADIRAAGGSTFVVDGDESLEVLKQFLHSITHAWRNA
jgi:hypothetical protein